MNRQIDISLNNDEKIVGRRKDGQMYRCQKEAKIYRYV